MNDKTTQEWSHLVFEIPSIYSILIYVQVQLDL